MEEIEKSDRGADDFVVPDDASTPKAAPVEVSLAPEAVFVPVVEEQATVSVWAT